ncbi:7307_t:CDS:2, partial [Dentiscutata erythropus]
MAEMYEYFDFSDYKPEHPIYKALGKEKIILNKKVSDQRAKGVQKIVVKKNLTHDMYKDCLKSRKECIITMHRLGNGITTLTFGDWCIQAYKKFISNGISLELAEQRSLSVKLSKRYQNECVSHMNL